MLYSVDLSKQTYTLWITMCIWQRTWRYTWLVSCVCTCVYEQECVLSFLKILKERLFRKALRNFSVLAKKVFNYRRKMKVKYVKQVSCSRSEYSCWTSNKYGKELDWSFDCITNKLHILREEFRSLIEDKLHFLHPSTIISFYKSSAHIFHRHIFIPISLSQ